MQGCRTGTKVLSALAMCIMATSAVLGEAAPCPTRLQCTLPTRSAAFVPGHLPLASIGMPAVRGRAVNHMPAAVRMQQHGDGGWSAGTAVLPLLSTSLAALLVPFLPSPPALAAGVVEPSVQLEASDSRPAPLSAELGAVAGKQQQRLWPDEAGAGMLLAEGGEKESPKAEVDEEHKVLNEVLDLVDQHFFDLSNEFDLKSDKSVGDSTSSHVYNSISWDQVRTEEASKPLKDRKSTYKEASKVLARLGDKYTRFLPPEDFQKLTKYDSTGVGVLLVQREGGLYVASPPLKGSTSEQEGVVKDDRFTSIGGVDVRQGASPFEGAELLSGIKGTTVTVEIERGGAKIAPVTLERKISVENPVTTYVVEAKDGCKVGYLRIKEFNGAVKRGVSAALQELRDERVDSYVLDLRGNLGGVLEGSLEIAGLFVDEPSPTQKRTIVYVKDRSGKEEPIWAQPRLAVDTQTPVFVLVDKKSASASEVLAGALQGNCRAVVVGKENSYGKGLIQGAFPMSDGSGTIITVAKYLTPKHGEIQGVGVEPDFKIKIGDARKAIKSGALNLKSAQDKIAACVPPDYDDGDSQSQQRSGTDSTLEQLNGRNKKDAAPKRESLFRSGSAQL